MREKGLVGVIILIVVLLVAVVVGGYFFYFNPRAQIDRAIKPDTSLETVSDTPRTEIVESGYNIELVITPSNNNVIADTVAITATQVSEEAAGVGFFITKDEEGFMEEGMPNLGLDRDAADGWSNTFDTTEYDNGKYYINVIVYPEGGEGNPLGVAQVPVEISN
jgi:uncharacterized protein (UPF0333 family)